MSKITPKNLAGSTTNGALLVRDTDDTFRNATSADISALGGGGGHTVLGSYATPTGGGAQSISITLPIGTNIINTYGPTSGGDTSGILFKGGAINTLYSNPSGGISGLYRNTSTGILSGTIYIGGGQYYLFDFLS